MDDDEQARTIAGLTADYRQAVQRTAEAERWPGRLRRPAGEPRSVPVAYMLWLVVGYFGIHRFYLGYLRSGLGMFVMAVAILLIAALSDFTILGKLLSIAMAVWWLIDALLIPRMAATPG